MTDSLPVPGRGTTIGALRSICARPHARLIVRRYLGAIALGNLVWEVLQLPLFTLWRTARGAYVAFAAFHCWLGDMLIASICLGLGVLVTPRGWPLRGYRRTAAVSIVLGVGYTIFSEWLNAEVRESWSYASAMPRVPPLGTGLSPLLQWIVVPTLAFTWAHRLRCMRGFRIR